MIRTHLLLFNKTIFSFRVIINDLPLRHYTFNQPFHIRLNGFNLRLLNFGEGLLIRYT